MTSIILFSLSLPTPLPPLIHCLLSCLPLPSLTSCFLTFLPLLYNYVTKWPEFCIISCAVLYYSSTLPPRTISIQSMDIGATFARVCWQPPSFRGIPTVSRYLIIVTQVNSTAQPLNLTTTDATRDFNVTGLAPGTTYEFHVMAISESGLVVGRSGLSEPFTATTNFTGTCVCVCVCVGNCTSNESSCKKAARLRCTEHVNVYMCT